MITKKILALAVSVFLSACRLFCADSVKIHITTKHHIVEGKFTRGMHVANQKFYTNEGQLFREINYDDSTYQIKSYTFYFYQNGRIFTEETFNNNDSLMSIIKYDYDPAGNLMRKTIYTPGTGKLRISERYDYKYNGQNSLTSVTTYSENKKITQTKLKYDPNGRLIKEQTVRKPLPTQDITGEIKNYTYNDKGLASEIEIRRRFKNGNEVQLKELRRYDDLNQIVEVKTTDNNGNQIAVKVYQYLMPGFLNTYEERDKENNITYQAHYDYKIHFMEIGTQQSVYGKEGTK